MTESDPAWVDRFICEYQMGEPACCADVVDAANRSTRWNQSLTVGGANRYDRDSDQLHYTPESPPVEHEPILAFAQKCLDHYVAERKKAGDQPQFGMPEGYNILRYRPGQAYHATHSDAGWPDLAHRHLTFALFLNTCADGELEFPEHGVRISPQAGRAVIFPAAWMYAHRSIPSPDERFIFNVFYGFPAAT